MLDFLHGPNNIINSASVVHFLQSHGKVLHQTFANVFLKFANKRFTETKRDKFVELIRCNFIKWYINGILVYIACLLYAYYIASNVPFIFM